MGGPQALPALPAHRDGAWELWATCGPCLTAVAAGRPEIKEVAGLSPVCGSCWPGGGWWEGAGARPRRAAHPGRFLGTAGAGKCRYPRGCCGRFASRTSPEGTQNLVSLRAAAETGPGPCPARGLRVTSVPGLGTKPRRSLPDACLSANEANRCKIPLWPFPALGDTEPALSPLLPLRVAAPGTPTPCPPGAAVPAHRCARSREPGLTQPARGGGSVSAPAWATGAGTGARRGL